MNQYLTDAASAVRSAYLDYLDAVLRGARENSPDDARSLKSEAEQFIVSMISSVALADGKLDQSEADFLCRLFNMDHASEGAFQFLSKYSNRWREISHTIPDFFVRAVQNDIEDAREILRMIQIIGNSIAVLDRDFDERERKLVQEVIVRFESYMEART